MNETSGTSSQMILLDSPNATSSQESADGPALCVLPGGQTTAPCGPAAAHVSLSAQPGKGKASRTSGTYGLHGSGSLASAALQRSLESRLRASVDLGGSTLFTMTWRVRATPSGRPILQQRASGRRTDDSGYGSWPTATVHDADRGGQAVSLASWATPLGRDSRSAETRKGHKEQYGTKGQPLNAQALQVIGWATPRSEDSESTGAHRGTPDTLTSQSRLAGLKNLGYARLAASGPEPSGSPAPTGKRGQLSPVLPCWLMGYPVDWILAAPRKKTRNKPE